MAGAGTYSFHNDAVRIVNSYNIISWALLLLIVLLINIRNITMYQYAPFPMWH